MRCNRLGKTDLLFSCVGLGGWALGNTSDWGPTSEADAKSTVSAALDAGINWIDTAPIYGESEAWIGRALVGCRHRVLLASKCGLVKNGSWTDHNLHPDTILHQLETSLQNLQTDYIDLYQIHYLDPQVPWQTALETLVRAQEQGKIRAIGVCNVPPAILSEMASTGYVVCAQDELSLLHPDKGLSVLPICRQHGLGFIAYGSLCGGILSGKYKKEPNFRRADARNYFYKCYRGEAFTNAQQTVARVAQLARQKQVPAVQIALAWALGRPGVTATLAGARTAWQALQNAEAAQIQLSAEEICSLQP